MIPFPVLPLLHFISHTAAEHVKDKKYMPLLLRSHFLRFVARVRFHFGRHLLSLLLIQKTVYIFRGKESSSLCHVALTCSLFRNSPATTTASGPRWIWAPANSSPRSSDRYINQRKTTSKVNVPFCPHVVHVKSSTWWIWPLVQVLSDMLLSKPT